MPPSTNRLMVFPTSDLIGLFYQQSGLVLNQQDTFELIEQMFTLLDTTNPWNLQAAEVALDTNRFMAFSHYPVNQIPEDIQTRVSKAAYDLLIQLYVRLVENAVPATPGAVDHTPYLMVGNDVCLKPFAS